MQTTATGVINCRAGKGASHQHRSSENDSEEADFSVDYASMTREGAIEMKRDMREIDKVGATPILVGCDHRSKAIWVLATKI